MATRLMQGDTSSWVDFVLRRRIALRRADPASDMVLSTPSLRTRALMAARPGDFGPMTITETPITTNTGVLTNNTGRR